MRVDSLGCWNSDDLDIVSGRATDLRTNGDMRQFVNGLVIEKQPSLAKLDAVMMIAKLDRIVEPPGPRRRGAVGTGPPQLRRPSYN